MKKIIASFIIVLTLFSAIFAHDGMMSGEVDIRVSKTKWFDIIYPARCEQTATLLYQNADAIYEEIGAQYGQPPKWRMPVVICPAVEQFNGYWTNGPYNHIVLYDTAMIEDLAVFSQTFLSTFRHECTHAYTYNMTGKAFDVLIKVFGSAINPVGWNVSSGMAEGATVTSESSSGEGRLNDEFSLQIIKQAKIERAFPDYWDVQGAADIYPVGSFYYFNAAFHEWLQKEYGMKKYGEFWYKCINFEGLSTNRCFKKTYGFSIIKAWSFFELSLKIPRIPANPIATGNVKDFFNRQRSDFSPKNNEGARYSDLSKNDRGVVYFEDASKKVFFVSTEDLTKETVSPKYLFTRRGIESLSTSRDGRFIAINFNDDSNATVRSCTMIYDMDTKKSFTLSDHNYFHPTLIFWNNDYYLIRQTYNSPTYSTKIQKLEFSGQKISGLTDIAQKSFPANTAPFSFTDLGNGKFAYIQKSGLEYSICVSDMSGNLLKKIDAPLQRMVIRYLSSPDGKNLYFSWSAPETMPRLGKLNLETQEFSVSEENYSGGVYYPVCGNFFGKEEVLYIGRFYRQNRLLVLENEQLVGLSAVGGEMEASEEGVTVGGEMETLEEGVTVGGEMEALEEGVEVLKLTEEIPFQKYNPFPYYLKGYWLPFSAYMTKSYLPEYTVSHQLPFGITYTTSNPWTTDILQLTAAWGNRTNSGVLDIIYNGGTDTNLLKYTVESSCEFDNKGWKKATGYVDLVSQYPFGQKSYFYTEAVSDINFGRNDIAVSTEEPFAFPIGDAQSTDLCNYLHWSNAVLLGYTNYIGNSGPGKYEKTGVRVYGSLYNTYFENSTTSELFSNNLDLQFSGVIGIPKLIPISCLYGLTYNLPSKLSVNLFPSSIAANFDAEFDWMVDIYHTTQALATARFDTLLFGKDFQKGPGWIYIYDFQITASYALMIVENEVSYTNWRFTKISAYFEKLQKNGLSYEDYAGIRIALNWGPNFGGTADSANKTSLYLEYGIAGLAGKHKSTQGIITIGFTSLF